MAKKMMVMVTEAVRSLNLMCPHLDVQLDDVMNPTLDNVIKFYEYFFSYFDINVQEVNMHMQQKFACPDAYKDLFYCHAMYICCKTVTKDLSPTPDLYKFSVLDILNPSPRTFKQSFMLVTNFLFFANNLLTNNLDEIEQKVKDKLEAINTTSKVLDEINTKMNATVIEIANIKDKKLEFKRQADVLLASIEEQLAEEQDNDQETETMKNVLAERKKECSHLMEVLEKELNIKKKLEEIVVDDHESIIQQRDALMKEESEDEICDTDFGETLNMKKSSELKYIQCISSVGIFNEEPPQLFIDSFKSQANLITSKTRLQAELEALFVFETDSQTNEQKIQSEKSLLQEQLDDMKVKNDCRNTAMREDLIILKKEKNRAKKKYHQKVEQVTKLVKSTQKNKELCEQHAKNMSELYKFYQKQNEEIKKNRGMVHERMDKLFEKLMGCRKG